MLTQQQNVAPTTHPVICPSPAMFEHRPQHERERGGPLWDVDFDAVVKRARKLGGEIQPEERVEPAAPCHVRVYCSLYKLILHFSRVAVNSIIQPFRYCL